LISGKPNRELSLSESFNLIFSLYRRHFLIIYIPILISQLIVLGTSFYLFGMLAQKLLPPPLPTETPSVLMSWLLSFMVPFIEMIAIVGIISWILGAIISGTCVRIASDSVETGTASLGRAFTFTLGRVLTLLAAMFIAGILAGIGLVLLIVPGIIITIIFYLIAPCILIEGSGVMQSFSRSIKLLSGRWLKTFAFIFIIGVITLIIAWIGGLISGYLGGAGWIAGSIIDSFAVMIYPIALAVYYYSMLARERGPAQPPPVPAPPAAPQTITA
jgi:hypothetical protein